MALSTVKLDLDSESGVGKGQGRSWLQCQEPWGSHMGMGCLSHVSSPNSLRRTPKYFSLFTDEGAEVLRGHVVETKNENPGLFLGHALADTAVLHLRWALGRVAGLCRALLVGLGAVASALRAGSPHG